jgi:hypothetical protein
VAQEEEMVHGKYLVEKRRVVSEICLWDPQLELRKVLALVAKEGEVVDKDCWVGKQRVLLVICLWDPQLELRKVLTQVE